MRATRQRDTKAERSLQESLDRLGLSFETDVRVLSNTRRRVDILFREARIAVFVDGCFWHGCPEHGTWPKRNAQFWKSKIKANRKRDADTNRRLLAEGWCVIRIWEHEDPEAAARKVLHALV
jgi:DNA mismatch endonuclease (patch repair protein)